MIVAGIYLLGGVLASLAALSGPPSIVLLASVYLAIATTGVAGVVAAMAGRFAVGRWLLLIALVLASPTGGTNRFPVVYPSCVSFPLNFTLNWPGGLVVFIGINLVPAILLGCFIAATRRRTETDDPSAWTGDDAAAP